MVLRIAVDSEDLTMSRFALSPLWELIHALRLLAGDPRHHQDAALRPWLARARDRYQELVREADVDVVLALHPPGWGADFLSPVPAGYPPASMTWWPRSGPRPLSRPAGRSPRCCGASRPIRGYGAS